MCGGLTVAGCQAPTKATLIIPLHSWTGERNYNKGLMSLAIERKRSLAKDHCGQTDSAGGYKLNLLPIKPEQDNNK